MLLHFKPGRTEGIRGAISVLKGPLPRDAWDLNVMLNYLLIEHILLWSLASARHGTFVVFPSCAVVCYRLRVLNAWSKAGKAMSSSTQRVWYESCSGSTMASTLWSLSMVSLAWVLLSFSLSVLAYSEGALLFSIWDCSTPTRWCTDLQPVPAFLSGNWAL